MTQQIFLQLMLTWRLPLARCSRAAKYCAASLCPLEMASCAAAQVAADHGKSNKGVVAFPFAMMIMRKKWEKKSRNNKKKKIEEGRRSTPGERPGLGSNIRLRTIAAGEVHWRQPSRELRTV